MIRFGLVGTGKITEQILRGALEDPRFRAVALCSRSEDRARRFISEHPEAFAEGTLIFTSVEDMAACPDVDAIYVGTPNITHRPYAVAALRGGKHVLCEKPLGCNAAEVEEMVSAARESGCVLMEAMISTLNPLWRSAVARLPELGKVRHYSSSYCQYSTRYEELKRGIVSNTFNPQMGGGALVDIGIYTTYPLVSLFGLPESVSSSLVYVPSPVGDVNIQGTALLRYPEMTASLTFAKSYDNYAPTEICGENGNLLMDRINIVRRAEFIPHAAPSSGWGIPPVAAANAVADSQSPVGGDCCTSRPVACGYGAGAATVGHAGAQLIGDSLEHNVYMYEFEEFIDVIESGRTASSVNSLETSLDNARLLDLIREAGKNK